MKEIIIRSIARHKDALKSLEANAHVIEKIASSFITTLKNKGKIIFLGNGGSAADAQHLAAELVVRFKKNRAAFSAIALSTDTSVITAVGNDFGFEEIFARQIESLAKINDLVVAISTSGKSKNVLKAVQKANAMGLKTIGFLGKDGGDLGGLVDVSLVIPVSETAQIQEMHISAGHIICDIVEEHFAKS